jgi:hypothetical protein
MPGSPKGEATHIREISQLTTDAVKPLFYEPDPLIQEKAIEKIKVRLNGKRGAGRGNIFIQSFL